ncbi:hypothetical protein J6590_076444 [Homalodisca vitripennis]|nr:hypothetical protein J6590_076444 [Homalodisca vitripennis]
MYVYGLIGSSAANIAQLNYPAPPVNHLLHRLQRFWEEFEELEITEYTVVDLGERSDIDLETGGRGREEREFIKEEKYKYQKDIGAGKKKSDPCFHQRTALYFLRRGKRSAAVCGNVALEGIKNGITDIARDGWKAGGEGGGGGVILSKWRAFVESSSEGVTRGRVGQRQATHKAILFFCHSRRRISLVSPGRSPRRHLELCFVGTASTRPRIPFRRSWRRPTSSITQLQQRKMCEKLRKQ